MRWWRRRKPANEPQVGLDQRVAARSREYAARTLDSLNPNVLNRPSLSYLSRNKVEEYYDNMEASRSIALRAERSSGIEINARIARGHLNRKSIAAQRVSIHYLAHEWTKYYLERGDIRCASRAQDAAFVAMRVPLECGTLKNGDINYPNTVWWRGGHADTAVFLVGNKCNLLNERVEKLSFASWIPSGEGTARELMQALVEDNDRDSGAYTNERRPEDIDPDWDRPLSTLLCSSVQRGQLLWRQWADVVFRCDSVIRRNDHSVLLGSPVWVARVPEQCYGWYAIYPESYDPYRHDLGPTLLW